MRYRALTPFCDLRRPFALAPPPALVGFLVAPLYPGHPEFPAQRVPFSSREYFTPEYLAHVRAARVGGPGVPAPDLGYSGVTRMLRFWFSDPDDTHLPVGNATLLARVLSVQYAIASHRDFTGDDFFDQDRRVHPRFIVPPGGNMDTLVWLAWRYVHAFATEAVVLAERLAKVSDDAEAARLVLDFVTPAATIPGEDFARGADLTIAHRDLLLWPKASPISALRNVSRGVVRQLRRALACGSVDPGPRNRRPYLLHLVDPGPGDDPDLLAANLHAYGAACLDVLGCVVQLLRIVGHLGAVARRLVFPRNNRVGIPFATDAIIDAGRLARAWSPCATIASQILEVDAGVLDTHFMDSAAQTGLGPRVWPVVEHDGAMWFHQNAWYGLALAWGIVPGDPDNLQRAGWCIPPPGGHYFPAERFKDPIPLGTEYPERPGAPSLTDRLREIQRLRLARGPMPKSPLDGADPFPWVDIMDVFEAADARA